MSWLNKTWHRLRGDTGIEPEFVRPTHPPTYDLESWRTCLHEAGHAVIAWVHPFVQVKSMERTVQGGRVQMACHLLPYPGKEWYDLTISMGGIAAEVLYFGSVRGGAVRADTVKVIARLKQFELTVPPWPSTVPKGTYKPSHMIRAGALEPPQLMALDEAYYQSRRVIIKHNQQVERLAHLFMHHPNLDTEQITTVLGKQLTLF